jgi:drug/metabolite transporter (DMT)-like permease
VLYAQTRASLGIVSALRETGVVWAALIGIVVFREGRARTLLMPALLVAVGVALMS